MSFFTIVIVIASLITGIILIKTESPKATITGIVFFGAAIVFLFVSLGIASIDHHILIDSETTDIEIVSFKKSGNDRFDVTYIEDGKSKNTWVFNSDLEFGDSNKIIVDTYSKKENELLAFLFDMSNTDTETTYVITEDIYKDAINAAKDYTESYILRY